MKKLLHWSILAASHIYLAPNTVFSSGSNTYGTPTWLEQATYTINDYAAPQSDLARSHADGDRWSSQLQSNLLAKYPTINTTRQVNLKDASVTWSGYRASNSSGEEMVFFSGHGNTPGMYMQDLKYLYPSDKSYGGWTRWLFISACEVLFNKDVNWYAPMFAGLHAVFGYESISYEYIVHECNVFGCGSYHRSEDVWDVFASNWVGQDMFMYDAYVQAVSATIYKYAGGVAPAAVYLYGQVNGTWLIGGTEKVWNMFNGDISWSSLNKTYRYEKYGTPKY